MDKKARGALRALDCDVRFDEPLARYGTYRIGGPATAVARPTSSHDVVDVVKVATQFQLPYLAIGLGSNILFDDEGFRGIIIRVAAAMSAVSQQGPEGTVWTVGAGLPIPTLAKRTAKQGHAGVHRLIGVPGAVGGGVFMNAGAHGQDFSAVVQSVTVVTDDAGVEHRAAENIPWQYRTSGLDAIVVESTIELEAADPDRVQRELAECLRRRRAGTPFDQPCCGSVFRNPPADATAGLPDDQSWTAGRLIEAAGLKQLRVGGAEVSPMHANYIVNTGGATSKDVKTVILEVERIVHEEFGVRLVREVKFVSPEGILEVPEPA